MAALAFVDLALTILEKFLPQVQQLVKKGEITVEQQQEQLTRLARLRPGGDAFTGPQWEVPQT